MYANECRRLFHSTEQLIGHYEHRLIYHALDLMEFKTGLRKNERSFWLHLRRIHILCSPKSKNTGARQNSIALKHWLKKEGDRMGEAGTGNRGEQGRVLL